MGKRVVVAGGGLTGLSAAYYLQKQDKTLNITLVEANDTLGGKLQTVYQDGFVIERGPDSFLKRKKEALELIKDLGLEDDVVSNHTGKSYILKDGGLHPIPEGSVMGVPTSIRTLMETTLLSDDGKIRALNDLILPRMPAFDDISVGEFFKYRLGEEMVDHIISPLLSGIYAGDIYKLSLQATQPQFIKAEKELRSLIAGLKAPKKTNESKFATLKSGLSRLIDKLAASLTQTALITGVKVVGFDKQDQHYSLRLSNGQNLWADAVIFAIPHEITAELLKAPYLENDEADPNTSVATIAMAFDQKDVQMDKEGTGFVVSRREPISITASTWTHMKWPHTAPEGKALIRCYLGKAGDDKIIHLSDEEMVRTALDNLKTVVNIKRQPHFSVVSRWEKAMPQYPVGHMRWLNDIRGRLQSDYPNVYLAGASYEGVGLPDCIKQGKEASTQVIHSLSKIKI
ncbi:oxygen-dependent protoporphyrinogen oxidase [Scopulibacillus daqui]|uniref:Coproporphyrinogen III oxidase n=1 Tax=Scopulibacillus daqui TaxID=1469162 RepID=A0ABS2PWJ2_9BACL|nr:protoporphyrinogen oxidase [Scopulibacillus daqui]MBM7643834.1 oxygen-dependent protoporphyrinogen oxidase [Scopulibacillus daqui]